MFGNKFSGDEIAKNFQKNVSKLREMKKTASQEVRPEDFLVASEEPVDVHSHDLDKKIQEVESYAQDDTSTCEVCEKKHPGKPCSCENSADDKDMESEEIKENHSDDKAEDTSYLVDRQAQYVLSELGKIAGNLRGKNKSFAADMVEATAIEIRTQAIKKASQKLEVVNGLKKMASEAYKKGDRLTGDVIQVTIDSIKKSK
jgi:hypothetical protein